LPRHTSLGHLVSGTPSAYSLYHHLIWSSGITTTSGPFVSNIDSKIPVQTIASLVPLQPTVMVGTISVLIGTSTPLLTSTIITPPPLTGKYVPTPIPLHGGKPPSPYVPPLFGGAYMSGSQTHIIRESQTIGTIPYGYSQVHY